MTVKIGFICTGNSARSQMAEGIARKIKEEKGLDVEFFSAGSKPAGYVHPLAVEVMKEIGVDISSYRSKSLEEIPYNSLDIVITLCSEASESCPAVSGQKVFHLNLPDPAKVEGSREEKLRAFRDIRDLIEKHLQEILKDV